VGQCEVGGGPDGGWGEPYWLHPVGVAHGEPVCSVGCSVRGIVAVPPGLSPPAGERHGFAGVWGAPWPGASCWGLS
jgi:hypothetical protein